MDQSSDASEDSARRKFVRFERDFDPFTGRYERGDYRRRTGEASVEKHFKGRDYATGMLTGEI